MYQRGAIRKRGKVMTVRDLILYADENQKFTVLAESCPEIPLYTGAIINCPYEIIGELVYQFKATDYNEIEVTLSI